MKVDGRCHCGAIAFEAEVKVDDIRICHCADCQALSGAPFRANIVAPAAQFKIVKGAPRRYIKTADSGAKRVHGFCEQCGSPIYSCAVDNPQSYSLRIGSLAQRHELGRPAHQIWTDRRLEWVDPLEDVPSTGGQP